MTTAVKVGGRLMRQILFVIAFAVTLGSISSAPAQEYPSRPITIVVPFAAGGPADVLARILAERMRTPLGQIVIIENVAGAAGSIGVLASLITAYAGTVAQAGILFSGVAAGDMTSNSAILWTRTVDSETGQPVATELTAQVAADPEFRSISSSYNSGWHGREGAI
jgi:tripartite-type tricarboxylate transporter receptor subunit TctC